jgi:hypothetical protein
MNTKAAAANKESMMAPETQQYLTVRQLTESYPAFPQSSIRWLIFNSKKNGFDTVIRRIGTKILISESAFLAFVERGGAAPLDQGAK